MNSGVPHKCPKCDGKGYLPFDPKFPLAQSGTSSGPWQCDVCVSGIIYTFRDQINVPSVWIQDPKPQGNTFTPKFPSANTFPPNTSSWDGWGNS